jgi:hypothetical protein
MPIPRRGLLAAAGLMLSSAATGQVIPARPKGDEAAERKRRQVAPNPMAVTQASFRGLFRQGLKVDAFAAFLREKAGIPRVSWTASLLEGVQGDALKSLRAVNDAAGIRSVLLDPEMGPGLASADAAARAAAIERLKPWLERAVGLGCVGVSIDLRGEGTYDDQYPRALEGLQAIMPLLKSAGQQGVIQSLGGMTSQGNFVAALLNKLGDATIRAEPTFNSWHVSPNEDFARLTGLKLLAPMAACVLADYTKFDDKGESVHFPTPYCMRAVRATDFRGPVVIHFNGQGDELEGVLKAKALLMRNQVQP